MIKKEKTSLKKEAFASDNDKTPSVNAFFDFWGPLIMTIALYSGIRYYLAEARYIPSGSMLPSLQINDRLLIEKITFRKRTPKRGEIVVFNSPFAFDKTLIKRSGGSNPLICALVNFPFVALLTRLSDPSCDAYIKRVIALAGDEVLVDAKGKVFINNNLIKENYVTNYCSVDQMEINRCNTISGKVPSNHVLVLGDNRANSWDGRFWPGSHFLPEKEIIGRAAWRFWPINRIGSLSL